MPIIYGKTWYHYLIKDESRPGQALEENIPIYSPGIMVVHAIIEDTRLFTSFVSVQEYIKYQSLFKQEDRSFFETILLGNQKIYFDVDISSKVIPPELDIDKLARDVINSLVSSLISVLEEIKNPIVPEDICLFSSNSKDKSKRSYHLVTHKLCVQNNLENKQIYLMIKNKTPPEYMQFVDPAMYSDKQQFRIVGSQKPGSGRIKSFMSTWYYKGKPIVHQFPETILSMEDQEAKTILLTSYIFEISLVSQVYDCTLIKDFMRRSGQKISTRGSKSGDVDIELNQEDIDDVMSRLPKGCYEKRQVRGSMIILSRLKPTDCIICKRIHQNENPYMVVTDEGEIRYFCRRSATSKVYGMLKSKVFKEESKERTEGVIEKLIALSLK